MPDHQITTSLDSRPESSSSARNGGFARCFAHSSLKKDQRAGGRYMGDTDPIDEFAAAMPQLPQGAPTPRIVIQFVNSAQDHSADLVDPRR
jgi:hypothetical protein